VEIPGELRHGFAYRALQIFHPSGHAHRPRPVPEVPADLAGDRRHGESEEGTDEVGGARGRDEAIEGTHQADGADHRRAPVTRTWSSTGRHRTL
jgi:hypothetical protein